MRILIMLSFALSFSLSFCLPTDISYGAPNYYKVDEQAALVPIDEIALPAQLMIPEGKSRADQVQVFDVKKGQVILTTKNNEQFQKYAHEWLSGITGFAPEVQPDLKAQYIVRVPLNPVATLQVGQTKIQVAEAFLFYYPNKEPMLLVFDEEKKPYLFHIHNDLKPFIKYLSIPD